ncbi:MAG: SH3 domain-containing protein [Candidatus Abyssobacteria bacterium SURF_5]|uniref:SH3 domain-containing protein n=1 Tax=Abyssobacteria bacterium (strain SURF_5) TaxID=2093360 RepID=A0A3A4NMV1_ABYX5|nr:MAG: SH3 domain-containing protein [Candidatus Abyssubacteria bacterium SURF_5]
MKSRINTALFLVLGILLLSSAAEADRIIPVGQVTNRVRVRHRPDTDSPAIGSLRFNESAELLESLPYWYHIKLDNGVPGYVSRAWTRKVSEAEGDGEIVRAGYWKIGSPAQKELDLKAAAQVIERYFDVIALSWVEQENFPVSGRALLDELGAQWAALPADLPLSCAILYRTAIIRACPESKNIKMQPLETAPDETPAPIIAFGCFEAPTNKSSTGIDFLFGVYSSPGNGEQSLKSLDKAIADIRTANPSERDVLVAGTFGVSAADLQDSIEAQVRTRGAGSVLDPKGELTGKIYDHLFIADEDMTVESIDAPQLLDVRSAAASPQEFYSKISDRLPLLLRLRTTGPDDD